MRPRLPSEALRSFADKLKPSDTEASSAAGHLRTIRTRLEQSFGVSRFIPIGSYARGTAIRKHSDVDFLAVLPRKVARWGDGLVAPATFIRNVANDLRDRYTMTGVRRDGQAVVLGFSDGAHSVDLVPGVFDSMHENRPMYLIPGNEGEWILTSPESHDLQFRNADASSGGKLGSVSRLIKGWKYGREPCVPITSFYIDMLLATTDVASGIKSYGQCLRDFFALLVRRHARGLQDPAGVAGNIAAAYSSAAIDRVAAAAKSAQARAEAALYAEANCRYLESIRQWGLVFNCSI